MKLDYSRNFHSSKMSCSLAMLKCLKEDKFDKQGVQKLCKDQWSVLH
jgi:hypothetical protein